MLKPVYKLISGALQKKNFFLIRGLMYLGRDTAISLNKLDYVRVATLELIAEEIKQQNVQGSVAELGVYQGEFSKYINQVFSQRKLFLFDTFKGFEKTRRRMRWWSVMPASSSPLRWGSSSPITSIRSSPRRM